MHDIDVSNAWLNIEIYELDVSNDMLPVLDMHDV